MKNQKYKKHKESEINSTDIMTRGMLLGCHQGLSLNDLDQVINTIKKFINSIK